MQIDMGMRLLDQEKIEKEEFDRIMDEHKAWLVDRKQGKRANLEDKNLEGWDLSGMDFSYADMRHVNLFNANLNGANLTNADLSGAFLHDADLGKAIINGADFSNTDLTMGKLNGCKGREARFVNACMWDCELREAELPEAYFFLAQVCDCDFTGANLEGAMFTYTDMDNSIFVGTNLKKASFRFADRTFWCDFSNSDMTDAELGDVYLDPELLEGVKGLYRPLFCPEEGSFVAWKKCREEKIVKLLIPEHAERKGYSLHSCRASEAFVLEIYDKDGNPDNEAVSIYDETFKYIKGQSVYAKMAESKYQDFQKEVSGIYFVLSREETKFFSENRE